MSDVTIDVEVTHFAAPGKALVVHRQTWTGDPDYQTKIEVRLWGTEPTWYVLKVADAEALIELLQDAVNVAKGFTAASSESE